MLFNQHTTQQHITSNITETYNKITANLFNEGKIDNTFLNVLNNAFSQNQYNIEQSLVASYGTAGIPIQAIQQAIVTFINNIDTSYKAQQTQMPQQQINQPAYSTGNPFLNAQQPQQNNPLYTPVQENVLYSPGVDMQLEPLVDQASVKKPRRSVFHASEEPIRDSVPVSAPKIEPSHNISPDSILYTLSVEAENLADVKLYDYRGTIQDSTNQIVIYGSSDLKPHNTKELKNYPIPKEQKGKDIILDITKFSVSDENDDSELMLVKRENPEKYHQWQNPLLDNYFLYKSLLKSFGDITTYIPNTKSDIAMISEINYNEYHPITEGISIFLDKFKLYDNNIVDPIQIKTGAEYLINLLNRLLENNIREYNEHYFKYSGTLDDLSGITQMMQAYGEINKGSLVKLFEFYIQQLSKLYYKDNSNLDLKHYLKEKKVLFIDNRPVSYFPIDDQFVLEKSVDFISSRIAEKFDEEYFEIYYLNRHRLLRITPIYHNLKFKHYVMYAQTM